ncbi:MAG: hypothetical protein Q9160_006615 [Pyrenula sp. 1 TL-2023]
MSDAVAKKTSESLSSTQQTASELATKTTESVSQASASVGGAFSGSFGGSANVGSKSTTTETKGAGAGLSKQEAGKLYEERIEDEYAKREGGA